MKGILASLQEHLAMARRIRRETDKGMLSQLREALALRFGAGGISLGEYFTFRLYDDQLYTSEQKRQFIGWRREVGIGQVLNARPWNVLTGDKLIGYAAYQGLGLAIPKTYAVYHPTGRHFGDTPCIASAEEMATFLRDTIPYPFFAKPAHGSFGRRSGCALEYNKATDEIQMLSGESIPVHDYVAECTPLPGVYPWEAGFVFQENLVTHQSIRECCGPTVTSMRIITLNSDSGPERFRAVWRIPRGNSMTDHYRHGLTGNLAGNIDVDSGRVTAVYSGVGPDMHEVPNHPDTGVTLPGFQIPDWEQVLELLDRATTAFPGVRMQHWDIAFTATGPVILELNTFGDFYLPQLISGSGFQDEQFTRFLDDLRDKYPAYRGKGDY